VSGMDVVSEAEAGEQDAASGAERACLDDPNPLADGAV